MGFASELNNEYKIETYRNRSEIEANLYDKDGKLIAERILVEKKKGNGDIDYLSTSRITAYEECPACFKREFLDRDLDTSSFFTKQGTIFHSVAEDVVNAYIKTGIQPDPSLFYDKYFDMFDNGYEYFSSLWDMICRFWKSNKISDWFFEPKYTEKEFSLDIDDVHMSGIIDLIGIDKTDPTIGWIVDYKSNIQPWTLQELSNSLQLQIYTIACKEMFPNVKTWKCAYSMLRYGWQFCPVFTDDQLYLCKEYIKSVYKSIKADTEFIPHLNRYCQYRPCRHDCDTYKNAMSNCMVDGYPINIEELCNQRDTLLAIEKDANGRRRELDSIIKSKIEEKASIGEKFIVGDREYFIDSISRPAYNYNDVYRVLLSNNKLDMLDGNLAIADNQSFDAQVNQLQDFMLKLQLLSCKSTGFSTSYVKSRKNRGD